MPQAGHGLRMIALITQSFGPRPRRSGPIAASVAPISAAPQIRPRGVAPDSTSHSSVPDLLSLLEHPALRIRELVRRDQDDIDDCPDAAATQRQQFRDAEPGVTEVEAIHAQPAK
jgi:hypothetical protein